MSALGSERTAARLVVLPIVAPLAHGIAVDHLDCMRRDRSVPAAALPSHKRPSGGKTERGDGQSRERERCVPLFGLRRNGIAGDMAVQVISQRGT